MTPRLGQDDVERIARRVADLLRSDQDDMAQADEGWPKTPAQIGEMVGVNAKTVMRAIHAGDLEASQLTQGRGGWRIWPDAYDAWRAARSNRTRAPRPMAQVTPVNAAAAAAKRARRQGAGSLKVTSEMGRAA